MIVIKPMNLYRLKNKWFIKLCLFNCLVIFSMPAVNAHSGVNGVWETLCTFNGLKLVQVEGEPEHLQPSSSGHCVFTCALDIDVSDVQLYSQYRIIVILVFKPSSPPNESDFYPFGSPPRAPPLNA